MAGMTSYLQKKILDDFLSIATYTVPNPLYLSLLTATPTETGSHANEITTSGSGYARQSMAAKMGATDATTGISVNTGSLIFGPATSNWGTISYIGVEDASSGGNMCLYGAGTTAKTVNTGGSFTVSPGQLAIQID
jgi:hypothetical protein